MTDDGFQSLHSEFAADVEHVDIDVDRVGPWNDGEDPRLVAVDVDVGEAGPPDLGFQLTFDRGRAVELAYDILDTAGVGRDD